MWCFAALVAAGVVFGVLVASAPAAGAQGCVDDSFEENDSTAAAAELSRGTHFNAGPIPAQICSGDGDYFEVYLYAGETFQVDLTFTDADGDIDLYLLDASETTVAVSNSSDDNEQFIYAVPVDGVYFIEVLGFGGAENSYDMALTVSGPCDVLSAVGGVVAADVASRADLDLAITCFNRQTPAGEYELTFTQAISYGSGEVVEPIDPVVPATITIDGAGFVLSGPGGSVPGEHLVTITGDSSVVIKRLIIFESADRSILTLTPTDSVTIEDSLILDSAGTGVFVNDGMVTITNSMIFLSGADGVQASGGSVLFERSVIEIADTGVAQNGGTVVVSNSTIFDVDVGVNAFGSAPATIKNSTIAGATTAAVNANADGSTVLVSNLLLGSCTGTFDGSSSHNLAVDATCAGSTVFAGTTSPTLADAGCAVPTPAPAGCVKVLIPTGNTLGAGLCDVALTTDQRGEGFPRSVGAGCDVGAYESPLDCSSAPLFQVDTADEYRNAIGCYNAAAAASTTTISFVGNVVMDANRPVIDNGNGASLQIAGNGHTLDANGFLAPVVIFAGDVTIDRLTITGSDTDAVLAAGGALILTNSTIRDSDWGLFSSGATQVQVTNTTFAGIEQIAITQASINGPMVLSQVTVVDNSRPLSVDESTGGATVRGSLFARNDFVSDCGIDVVDGGGNVADESLCGLVTPVADLGDSLGDLALNPCALVCTETVALLSGSAAIDAGGDCVEDVDQRGAARSDGACDAGAFEAVVCDGRVVTIDMNTNGGVGLGTSGPDVILGTPGDDVIDARGGDDVVCAGDGEDVVNGGSGADRIFGGRDADQLYGDGQDDKIWGEHGHDRLEGGDGDDKLRGNGGNDRLYGQDGKDTLWGFNGDDRAWGGDGDDKVRGNADHDELYGGNGDDRVTGGDGNDLAYGGSDNDEVVGGTGTDELHGDGGDDVLEGNGSEDTLYGGGGQDDLYGGGGNDEIFGEGSNDEMFGGGGQNDLCDGGSGTDVADSACENTANL